MKITAEEFRAFLLKEILRISKSLRPSLELLVVEDETLFDNEFYRFAYGKNAHITGGWLQILGEYIIMHKASADNPDHFDYFVDKDGIYQAIDKRIKEKSKEAYM